MLALDNMREAMRAPMLSIVILTSVLGGAVPGAAAAESTTEAKPPTVLLCPICKRISERQMGYAEKAGNTLARGALNTSLGWTELIRQPAQEVKRGGNAFVGIANGVGQGLNRTFTGLAELFTFWTPKVQGQYLHFSKDCPLDATQ